MPMHKRDCLGDVGVLNNKELYYHQSGGTLNREKCWQICGLAEKDFEDVCTLCQSAFPLNYPLDWYKEVVNGRYISFGLFHNGRLTSLLVAERKKVIECDIEDQTLCRDPEATVVYILSLAVDANHRRKGIASILLDHLIMAICTTPPQPRLVYLHVLFDNKAAISFYRKNGFRHHVTLTNYYQIDGEFRDGCTFVRYISPGPVGEFVASVCDFCASLVTVLATPFRLCFTKFTNQSHPGDTYPRHERLVSM